MATYQVGRGRVKVVGTMVAGGSSRAPKRDLGKKGLLARLLSLSFSLSVSLTRVRAYALSLSLPPFFFCVMGLRMQQAQSAPLFI